MLDKIRALRPEYQSTAYIQGFLAAMLFVESARRCLDAGKPLTGPNWAARSCAGVCSDDSQSAIQSEAGSIFCAFISAL